MLRVLTLASIVGITTAVTCATAGGGAACPATTTAVSATFFLL